MTARAHPPIAPQVAAVLRHARAGSAYFEKQLGECSDAELDGATLLPGWTRRDVAAHVGFNAVAIGRLAEWAGTGVPTPMYESVEERNREIERGATLDPAALRALVSGSAARLDAQWRDLPENAWANMVRTIQGREVPASETVWMRTREVWVHAVDLAAGGSFTEIPAEVLERILGDIVRAWKERGDGRDLVLRITGGERDSVLGDTASVAPEVVAGTLAGLAEWATGRGSAGVTTAGAAMRDAPRWL